MAQPQANVIATSPRTWRSGESTSRAKLLLSVVIGGLFAAFFTSRRRWIVARLPSRGRRRQNAARARSCLRQALVGKKREAVARLLGPAPTVAESDLTATWYYPADAKCHSALVIEFDGAIVHDVQLTGAPRRHNQNHGLSVF